MGTHAKISFNSGKNNSFARAFSVMCPAKQRREMVKYCILLYRHGCFTEKYTTRKIHTQLHPGPEWRVSISRFFTAVYVWVVVCLYNKKNITR